MDYLKRRIIGPLLPLLLLTLIVTTAKLAAQSPGGSANSLQSAFGKKFTMGVAVGPADLSGESAKLILQQFGSLTPENAMKMGPVHPRENEYNWKAADSIAAFARRHGLKLRGHTLCWHQQVPSWIFTDNTGAPANRSLVLKRLHDHIKTVVGRYRDIVYAWDVVNEAISDAPGEYLRNSPWLSICGEEYIALAFQWAHEADPDALLFYNDYNEIDSTKRSKIIRLVTTLQKKGVPVHGIGLQGHWAINEPTPEILDACLRDFTATGLPLQITELDVSVYPKEHQARSAQPSDSKTAFTPAKATAQQEQYLNCFRIFGKYRQMIQAITFWNVSDKHTWLDNFPVRNRKDYPLLFDVNLKPKQAYHILLQHATEILP
ncbi:endo-1,4-beta-xylanase [Flavihumibacter petaseus]|uniref:Beta-xylanase n=1 Tax=Flavihumibacter petaseus NBRC 106054 TaxID=1220578 RepID=A0A0E9MWT2_9BACT|nr:endo-1,4-beta-xylanase [Flavihumibacter petaseus]GAO41871.1 endo-1,4-beta-xylanase [Flavihumibacter petaseus NBRC 106054]